MTLNIAENLPGTNYRNELTLAGAIRKYWPEISRNWKAERTITGNVADYENRILEVANSQKGLERYTMKDFELIIKNLSDKGNYMQPTTDHYLHLINIIIITCLEAGERLDDSLIRDAVVKSHKMEKKGLVKSLTREDVDRMLKWIRSCQASTITGPELAVIYMFFLGLRNSEAAALKFANHYYDRIYECWMVNVIWTMIGKSRNIKLRGKTANAHRVLPVIDRELNVLFQARKIWIKDQVGKEDIDMFPICCRSDNLYEHCTYDEVNVAAKKIFDETGIKGNTWNTMMSGFSEENYKEFISVVKEEKDPTAYLLRRHASTIYYACDLTGIERRYLMGHDLENIDIERADFLNPDLMLKIIEKLKEKEELYG